MTHNGPTPKFSLEECRAIVEQMWPYLDGALSPRDRDLVAEHVAVCSKCQPHFVFAKSFLHAVRLASAPQDLSGIEGKVLAALTAEGLAAPEAM